jgi:hypothetical protein
MREEVELVAPTATRVATRRSAPRWDSHAGLVVLSDSMLNVNAGWGELILETFASILPGSELTRERISRPQIGDHRPQEWIDQLATRGVCALVVTAGDCATCTSRALRECVLAEDSGIPATAILPSALTEIIQATLSAWGRPDLQVATFDTPLFALKKEDFPEVMQATAEHARDILMAP